MFTEYLYFVGNIVSYILFIGLVIYSGIAFYEYYVDSKERKSIHILEAKISMLRMMLKAKIRHRVNKFQQKKNNSRGEEKDNPALAAVFNRLRGKYEEMSALEFQNSDDYNKYLDLSFDVILEIEDHQKKKKMPKSQDQGMFTTVNEPQIPQDRWSKLLYYDKKTTIIISEIISCTSDLKSKIELYNLGQKKSKKHFEPIKSISVNDYETLYTILAPLKGESHSLEADSVESSDELDSFQSKKAA